MQLVENIFDKNQYAIKAVCLYIKIPEKMVVVDGGKEKYIWSKDPLQIV